METMPSNKYRAFPPINLPDRKWPSQQITKAPLWCSVDLRDGNQSLVIPMSTEEKRDMFDLLVSTGFKEIEIGFPSASRTEYEFMRILIEEALIPDDVTIQVLTQAREHLIRKSFESLRGAKKAVVHLYNSTSELQRRVVFKMDRKEIIEIARAGTRIIREEAERTETEIILEYSPESFTGTELDFAVEICEAVMDVWGPSPEKRIILNLPSTVEMATPNVYADQIEWFCRHIKDRDCAIISTHAHNDRGTAVAATELALLAGAERVEGTLFGNGERTGNVDIITVAMNIFSQGIDPELDFSDINRLIGVYERCAKMAVPARHPYAGELVYTAFSGSHQDAINKGMKIYKDEKPLHWEVPYLPIDPSDVGRSYESIIRINSQSGKGGVAWVMESEYGFQLPKPMHPEFGAVVQAISDRTGKEVMPAMIREAFEREYLLADSPISFIGSEVDRKAADSVVEVIATVGINGSEKKIAGRGNGPIDAFSHALRDGLGIEFRLVSYHEHAMGTGSDSKAAAYIQIEDEKGRTHFGVGVDTNIDIASFRAIISSLNRSQKMRNS
ncbi:MAG: 2-isopropylmalate synthase [Thermodesulfovibrionales bacterium]|jgi:2-isopropylmalate synthase